MTFRGINLTTKSGRNRKNVAEAVEKSTSHSSVAANATAEKRRGFRKAKKWWFLFLFFRFRLCLNSSVIRTSF